MALHEMFALAMSNIPENETDNFTAKLAPAYLALCQLLENLEGFKVKPKTYSKFINTTAYIRVGFIYLHFTKRLKNEKIILLILLISSFANAQQNKRVQSFKSSCL
jgi:hypothetical protein